MKLKIVFLDIDGVINSDRSDEIKPKVPFPQGFYIPFKTGWSHLDKECIDHLNNITDATGAVIVISSSWRVPYPNTPLTSDEQFKHLAGYLKSQGIKAHILDMTPTHWPRGAERINTRGAEIEQWLDDWPGEIESFVVLDDGDDIAPFEDYHVQPDEEIGLRAPDEAKAIKILTSNE